MNFLFLMDELSTINCHKDTTFILMVGAHNRGHRTFYLAKDGITYNSGKFFFKVTQVIAKLQSRSFLVKEEVILTEEDVQAIFIRTDPPFDHQYLVHTWLLDRVSEKIAVVNHPSGIRAANEKLWALQFPNLIPPTLVTSHLNDFRHFLNEHKCIIAKPDDGFGGSSIFKINDGDLNASVIYETLTQKGKQAAIFQKYIPEAEIGDKRVLLLNGNPMGAILRVHDKKDHRNNLFAGGHVEKTILTSRDMEIIQELKPKLIALGLFFVGIDLIGDYLIEVNVTSPTCLQDMNAIYQQSLEDSVIERLESFVRFKNA